MLSFLKPNKLKVKSTLLILFTQIVFFMISSSIAPNLFPDLEIPENKQKEIETILEAENLISQEVVESVVKLYLVLTISLIAGTYISVSLIIENFFYESK